MCICSCFNEHMYLLQFFDIVLRFDSCARWRHGSRKIKHPSKVSQGSFHQDGLNDWRRVFDEKNSSARPPSNQGIDLGHGRQ